MLDRCRQLTNIPEFEKVTFPEGFLAGGYCAEEATAQLASTLNGSTEIPFLTKMKPNNLPVITTKMHLCGFRRIL